MDKDVKKGAKGKHTAPKLEIRGMTVERPLAKKQAFHRVEKVN